MKQPSLAIFANFFIDNEERLQRMKDSFNSFKEAEPNQWVINIRGSLKHEAGNFLKEELGEKLNLFYLQSGRGWFYDSNTIASKINSNYVLFWVEDHILINSPNTLNNCIAEMNKFNVDQLLYSFLISDIKKNFAIVEPYKSGEYIKVLKLDSEICLKTRKLFGEFYTVSCPTIMSKNFFTKILLSRKPYLKRWPRNVPFDFEKLSKDNIAKVISVPKAFKTPIKKGDLIMIHHNVFRRFYDMKGREKNSKSYFKENKYFVQRDQIYLYKRKTYEFNAYEKISDYLKNVI